MSVIHLLHIPKTGGSALIDSLRPHAQNAKWPIRLHNHAARLCDITCGDKIVFVIRDPLQRFASGFYSRQRQGRPRFHNPWTEYEQALFARYQTPNQLAEAIYAKDEFACNAFREIGHFYRLKTWTGNLAQLADRRDDILFVAQQEQLEQDFTHLLSLLDLPAQIRLPANDFQAHRSPANLDRRFSAKAQAALMQHYALDYAIIKFCKLNFTA